MIGPAAKRRPTPRATRVRIDLRFDDAGWRADWPSAAGLCRKAVRAVLQARPSGLAQPVELCLVLSNDARVRFLNRVWRRQDKPTNVLSFPAAEAAPAGAPLLLGDVVLARETIRREARAQGKPTDAHLQHLVVHGVLHLLGHDHVRAADAAAMERLEVAVLARLGVPNPYEARPRRAATGR